MQLFPEYEKLDPELASIRTQLDRAWGTSGNEGLIAERAYQERLAKLRSTGKLNQWKTESAAAIGKFGYAEAKKEMGGEDIQKAREAAAKMKTEYLDVNPFAAAAEQIKTGMEATFGRQTEIERRQLQASLERMGPGVNALRRFEAQRQLGAQVASKYMEAQGTLGQLQMSSADRALQAINTYANINLNIAQAARGLYQTYWSVYESMTPNISFSAGFGRQKTAGSGKNLRAPGGLGEGMPGLKKSKARETFPIYKGVKLGKVGGGIGALGAGALGGTF